MQVLADKVMNDLHPDLALQIYSRLTNQELWKLTGTELWYNVSALLSSDSYSRTFWKMRVAHLSGEERVIPYSLDVDWRSIYSFVVSYGGVERRMARLLSLCNFDLANYSFHYHGLRFAIEAYNIRATSLLLQAGCGDRESLIEMTSDLLEDIGETRMTSLLVDHLRDPVLDRHLQHAVRERNCVMGALVVFVLISGAILFFHLFISTDTSHSRSNRDQD